MIITKITMWIISSWFSFISSENSINYGLEIFKGDIIFNIEKSVLYWTNLY